MQNVVWYKIDNWNPKSKTQYSKTINNWNPKLTIGIQNAKCRKIQWNPKCKMQKDKKIDIWNAMCSELRIEI